MKTKRTNLIAWFYMAGLLFATEIHAAKFPAYLKMDGTKIVGCDKAALPANLVIPDGVTEIESYAFYGCTSLVTVAIPASITTIGNDAFAYCENIKTVQYMGTLAQWCQMDNDLSLFYYAKSITMLDVPDLKAMTTLTIPNGVTKIGQNAFSCCASISIVSIPASVKSIGYLAFYGCENIKTVQYRGTLAQWCQMDNGGDLVTKANTITMFDVADLKAMTALEIPEGVTNIGQSAFYGCKSITTISIPTSVTNIGGASFYGCDSLTSLEIPKTVTEIGYDAFANCTSLANVTMADGLEKICGLAFSSCKSLTTIMIPNSVTEIGYLAFAGCTSLATISIPANLANIGEDAFDGCGNIKTVQYRGTLAQWCQMDNGGNLVAKANTITMFDVADLKAMTVISIPKDVTKIGNKAFYDCKLLTSVTIPEGVTEIGYETFRGCKLLETLSIPASITKIGVNAFADCGNIKTVQYGGTFAQWCQMDNSRFLVWNAKSIAMSDLQDLKTAKSLSIPKGVTKIGFDAFYGCKSLESIMIAEGVIEIGANSFRGCEELATISIPSSVKSIGENAFEGCENIKTVQYMGTLAQWCKMDNELNLVMNAKAITMSDIVDLKAMPVLTIPKGVKEIGAMAFALCCDSFKSISFPKNLTKIRNGAFLGCSSLASLEIPGNVTEIEERSFALCTSLTNVTIADGVTKIGFWAFKKCTSLASVTIPASVKEIGLEIFSECPKLTEVNYLGTKAQWLAFNVQTNRGTIIHCTDGDYAQN